MRTTNNSISPNMLPIPPTSSSSSDKGSRGKSKKPNFRLDPDGNKTTYMLELDLSDTQVRDRVEKHENTAFALKCALQRDAQARIKAYNAAKKERRLDPKALRIRLGLTKKGLEKAARNHIINSKWMRDHITQALGQTIADQVWESVDRYLFPDKSGKRHGQPKVGRWYDFQMIPGRARSHTKNPPVWESYRLVGSVDGHLNMYRHPNLDANVVTAVQAGRLPSGVSVLKQPKVMPIPEKPPKLGWQHYQGPLALLFTGLGGGDLVIPIRLPQGSGEWAHLNHFLSNPDSWHKIDLIRVQDKHTQGGWRYYGHLLTTNSGYISQTTRDYMNKVPQDRVGGVDGNVRKLAIISKPQDLTKSDQTVESNYITLTVRQEKNAKRAADKARKQQKQLDRSRRVKNQKEYRYSKKQALAAARRVQAGLSEPEFELRKGERKTKPKSKKPAQPYFKDTLTNTYFDVRTDLKTDSRSASQAKQARALSVAMLIVLLHGSNLTIEDCDIRTWARRWGKSIMLFSPGMLITALKTECERNGGRLIRASTYTTAMSQHCLCGMRVSKALNDRKHVCSNCGLSGDRDLVSAALAACTILSNVEDPRTARVDYELAEHMRVQLAVQQEVPIRSTSNSLPLPHGEKGGSRSRDSESRISSPVKSEMDSLNPEQGPYIRKRRRNRPKTPKNSIKHITTGPNHQRPPCNQ